MSRYVTDAADDGAPAVGEIREAAREVFGHDRLRPGQEEATKAVLDGRDVLLVLPTGAGKSLAYQLPAVLVDGPTIVLSPLLALQHDQVTHLAGAGEQTLARRVSSAETPRQRAEALAMAAAGEVEFLFMSPEQLANDEVRREVAALQPSLVAVDEAHCVSSWGHDFRPDYLRLGELITELGSPRIIALTATAAPPVRRDIVAQLRMQNPITFVADITRDNIHLSVVRCLSDTDQRKAVVEAAVSTTGPGIVYVRTRAAAEEYADLLNAEGLLATAYHAGLSKRVRDDAHRAFMAGEVDVMVATSAFGMGVDKADIRYVLHAHAPESPDSYYQEVGRAGRDGAPSVGVLFYRPEDLSKARFFTPPVPDADDVAAVLGALARDSAGNDRPGPGEGLSQVDRARLAKTTGLSARAVSRILNLMNEAARAPDPDQTAVQGVLSRAEAHKALQRSRIEMMRGYAESVKCRRQFLLGYFGDEGSEPCRDCDNCHSGAIPEEPAGDLQDKAVSGAFAIQGGVRHPRFGDGVVMDIDGDQVTVLFSEVGYRTLHLPTVVSEELLEAV